MHRHTHALGGILGMVVVGLALASCGGQTLHAPPAASTAVPDSQRILLVRSPLPSTITYQVLGPLSVRKLSYGGADWALQELATAARKAGANAVMEVTVSFAPSYLGWATPHGTGTAVRILSPPVEEVAHLSTLHTEWW